MKRITHVYSIFYGSPDRQTTRQSRRTEDRCGNIPGQRAIAPTGWIRRAYRRIIYTVVEAEATGDTNQ